MQNLTIHQHTWSAMDVVWFHHGCQVLEPLEVYDECACKAGLAVSDAHVVREVRGLGGGGGDDGDVRAGERAVWVERGACFVDLCNCQ